MLGLTVADNNQSCTEGVKPMLMSSQFSNLLTAENSAEMTDKYQRRPLSLPETGQRVGLPFFI